MDTPSLCQCGCGAPVARRYKPGHDARHKSALVTQAVEATTPSSREAAIAALIERGWESFLPLDLLRAHPSRNHRRQVKIHIDQADRFLVDLDGQHHTRHNCTRLTQCAKRHGQINPTTRLARESAIRRLDPTPSLLQHLRTSWDLCPECSTDWTLDEQVETSSLLKAVTLDAIDHTTPGWKPKPTPARKPTPFEVEPDPIPVYSLPLPFLPLTPTTCLFIPMLHPAHLADLAA